MNAIRSAAAFVVGLERRGVRFSIESGRLIARPARLVGPLRATFIARAESIMPRKWAASVL